LVNISYIINVIYSIITIDTLYNEFYDVSIWYVYKYSLFNPIFNGIFFSFWLSLKTCIMIFVFIWARASFPRIRFDQLMSFCWTVLLPIVIAFIILVPCLIYVLEILPFNINL
jgi:NADH-ubiquinone oxidoreductase chain 1